MNETSDRVLFTARVGAFERLEELNAVVLVLAENLDGSGSRIEFQRSIETDEQDALLGMDTYCVCLGSGETHYGGLDAWSVIDSQLHLRFDERAARALRIQTSCRIPVDASLLDVAIVARGLMALVGESHVGWLESPRKPT